MTNRILPETLPALYRKHGVVPAQRCFGYDREDGKYACGLGINFYVATNGRFTDGRDDDLLPTLGLGREYTYAYARGWDGSGPLGEWFPIFDRERADEGYLDGAAGWAAVKDLAVAE